MILYIVKPTDEANSVVLLIFRYLYSIMSYWQEKPQPEIMHNELDLSRHFDNIKGKTNT